MPLVQANLISDWRRGLISELKTAYPDAEVSGGRRTGVSRDKVRICVFHDGYAEEGGRVVVAHPIMVVRFWPRRDELPTSDTPADPLELEQAEMGLMALFQDRHKEIESAIDGLWYFRAVSARTDEDPGEWGVEVRLEGFAENVAAIA